MFLFQSSKDKKIRVTVQEKLERCISNPTRYKQSMETIMSYIKASDQKAIEMVVDKIKATMKEQDATPSQKYQCILLLRDLMSTQNKALGKYVVKKILKRITIFAQHKKQSKQQDRGKDIFGKQKSKEEQQASVKFLNTLLNAIEQWRNWPKSPDGPHLQFKKAYEDLLLKNVTFPKQRKIAKQSHGMLPPPPSASNARKSLEKQETPYPRQGSITPTPQRPSGKKQQIAPSLANHFNQIITSLQVLIQILQGDDIPDLQFLGQMAQQVIKTIGQGDGHIAQLMQNPDENKVLIQKIQKSFEVSEKLTKDMRVINKKPQMYEVFRSKYLKLGKQLTLTLSHHVDKNVKEKQYIQPKVQIKPATPTPSPIQQKRQSLSPAIRETNQYNSTQKFHLKLQQQRQIPKEQFNSGSSNRFGSIGNAAALAKMASARSNPQKSEQQHDSPAKNNKKDTEIQDSRTETQKNLGNLPGARMGRISQEHNESGNGFKGFNNSQIQQQRKNQIRQNNRFQSDSRINSNQNKSKNDTFGSNSRQAKIDEFEEFNPNAEILKPSKKDSYSEDFFEKIQQNDRNPANILTRKQRRGQNNRQIKNDINNQPKDFFQVEMQSKVVSDGLSAFTNNQTNSRQKNQIQQFQSKSKTFLSGDKNKRNVSSDESPSKMGLSINVSQIAKKQPEKFGFDSKTNPFQESAGMSFRRRTSEKSEDNPFATNYINQQQVDANFNFDQTFDKKSQSSNPFSEKGQNPFADGQQNPFEASSHHSNYNEPCYVNRHEAQQNPFQTNNNTPRIRQNMNIVGKNSFRKDSQKSRNLQDILKNSIQAQSKHQLSVDRLGPQNPFQASNLSRSYDNPFAATTKQSDKASKQNGEDQGQIVDFIRDFNKGSDNPLSKSFALVPERLQNQQQFNFEDFNDPNRFSKVSKISKQSSNNSNIFREGRGNEQMQMPNFKQFSKQSQFSKVSRNQSNVSKQKPQFNFSDFGKDGDKVNQSRKQNQQFNFSDFGKVNDSQQIKNTENQQEFNFSDFGKQKSQISHMHQVQNNQAGFNFTGWAKQTVMKQPQQINQVRQTQDNFRFSDFGNKSNLKESIKNTNSDFFKQVNKQNKIQQQTDKQFDKQSESKEKGLDWNDFGKFGFEGSQSSVSREQPIQKVTFDQESQKSLSKRSYSKKSQSLQQKQQQFNLNQKQDNSQRIDETESSKGLRMSDFPAFNNTSQQMKKPSDIQGRNFQQPQRNNINDKSVKSTNFAKKKQSEAIDLSQQRQDRSLSLNFEDFSPVAKKGISWNPLGKKIEVTDIEKSYNIAKDDIIKKKKQLQLKQEIYNKEAKRFQKLKQANAKAKSGYVEQLSKGQDIIAQKEQYQQILRRLMENNETKQGQIDQINNRIKRAQNIKNRILQKQKLLFEKSKKDNGRQQKQRGQQNRNNTCKWQIFNKNMQNLRNASNNSMVHNSRSYIL